MREQTARPSSGSGSPCADGAAMKSSTPSKPRGKRLPAPSALGAKSEEEAFAEVVEMIQTARGQTLRVVNSAVIDLYWRVGEYISRKLETASWGEGVVEALARYIQHRHPTYAASHGLTSSECGSSTTRIGPTKKSRHWCDNCRGPITSSFWDSPSALKSVNSTCALPFANAGASESWNVSFELRHSNAQSSVPQ